MLGTRKKCIGIENLELCEFKDLYQKCIRTYEEFALYQAMDCRRFKFVTYETYLGNELLNLQYTLYCLACERSNEAVISIAESIQCAKMMLRNQLKP